MEDEIEDMQNTMWNLEHGVWNMGSGARDTEDRIWNMKSGRWSVECGICDMDWIVEYGIWNMEWPKERESNEAEISQP